MTIGYILLPIRQLIFVCGSATGLVGSNHASRSQGEIRNTEQPRTNNNGAVDFLFKDDSRTFDYYIPANWQSKQKASGAILRSLFKPFLMSNQSAYNGYLSE